MKTNAFELFIKQKRFDLIFKYLYLTKRHILPKFYKELYLEHIRAFNDFEEIEPSDGKPKNTPEAFVNSFNSLYENIKDNGFDTAKGIIPIGDNGEISDGAHRLTIAAVLGIDVEVENDGRADLYDYKFFRKQHINPSLADYAAFEYVKLNPKTYIVNLHAVAPRVNDEKVERILQKYGTIFYQKDVYLNFNGYVNLKKISYGSFWNRESWIGNVENKFRGAQMHAESSIGEQTKEPLRAYVFVCECIDNVLKAKEEIRQLENLGNFSVHINDFREEAIFLASIYFNDNSIQMLNIRPFDIELTKLDSLISQLKGELSKQNASLEDVCGAGSTPLNVAGIRESADLDFLYAGEIPFSLPDGDLSHHGSELQYYPYDEKTIVHNPLNHFYYNGMKFISLDVLLKMKTKRNEVPKDVKDCEQIRRLMSGAKPKRAFKIFEKKRLQDRKVIILFGKIVIPYKKLKCHGK